MRILIAEDDPISRKILHTTLKKWKYDVIVTENGEDALQEMLKEDAPQLAILDWMMPGLDGPEICERVRQEDDEKYRYIILLTALEKKENVAQGLNAGADDYVTKPFSAAELKARISVGIRMIDLQNALANQMQRLREMDKMKTNFLSIVSHELRTPIAIMQEGVSLCLDGVAGDLTDMQRELLEDTLDNSDRLLRLITDLLNVSKIEAGRVKLHKRIIDFHEIVRKTLKTFEHQAAEKGVVLATSMSEKPLMAYIDSDKVIQIFSNLVSNALRFTEKGGTIETRIEFKEDHIYCQVSDNGKGISKENLPKLFNKFEQIGRVEGPGYQGTGLGLTIVKGLIEKHNGKVWVDSELGKGTTFHFTVQYIEKPLMLIVDDEQAILDIMQRTFNSYPYQIMEAMNGEEAIYKTIEYQPSLLILDMKLPKMSGYEVIGRLKQDTRTMDVPIIIMSGYEIDPDRLDKVQNHSAIPVIQKPFDIESLKNKVEEILGT